MSLASTIAKINKTYGEGTCIFASDAKALEVERVPWGIFSIDVEIGGGVPMGRITQIHGPYSSGKTTLAVKLAAQVQKLPKVNKVAWIDAEGAFDRKWFEGLGMDMKKTIIVQPDEGPKGLDMAEELVRTREIGLLVVDSVANIVPIKEIEESIENQGMALHARLINKFIRKISMALMPGNLTGSGNKCIVLLLNQERQTMNKYQPIVTPGGMGKEFAASLILGIRRGDWISGESAKMIAGHEIHFKVEKNKTYPPKREGMFDFYFKPCHPFQAGDIDNEKSVILYGIEKFIIERTGSIYHFDGKKFKGKEPLLEYFKDHPEKVERLKEQLIAVTPARNTIEVNGHVKKKKKFKLRLKRKK